MHSSLWCRFSLFLLASCGLLVGLAAAENVPSAPPPNFRNDVMPIFAKAGCNMGACHGALAGKGGFKLSLRGYDPVADYFAIAHEARGRRIEPRDPGRSLILAKPSGAIRHKGGIRFDIDSNAYRIISEWIALGAQPPTDDDPHIQRLVVEPAAETLKPQDNLALTVKAHFSDGEVRDVTEWAKYESAQLSVANVDESGKATVVGPGKAAIVAWYASKTAVATVTVPYENEVSEAAFTAVEDNNFIDKFVLEQLKLLNLPPSEAADDATFFRRAFIDTIGTLPTASEVRSFLADESPDKRAALIDSLLARPEFVDYWTYKWSDLLLVNGAILRPAALKEYYEWIRGHVERNTPWDEFARQLVLSKGNNADNGATAFFTLHQDAEGMTENVCQAFLGLSIGCAKCHNHPLEKWTNDQYYAMANMFARVKAKGWGGDGRSGDGLRTVFVSSTGELIQPQTGRPQPPTPLDGQPLSSESDVDRRIALADWLTSPDNPYFARAITNRVWANFFGTGLVESVDDMRDTNPASNEKLLAALADYFVEQNFDIRALIRKVLESSTYARASEPLAGNESETRFYSRYYPRRMMAEVLHDAVVKVTGVPTPFTQLTFPGSGGEATDIYPLGTRAIQLHDSAVASNFLKSFGRNPRSITCECERSNEPSMVQVLHLSNGDTTNEKLADEKNRLTKLLATDMPDYRLIEDAYLETLSRFPTNREMKQLLAVLSQAEQTDKRTVFEDIYWSLLTSREFLFNH